ncbi:carboxylesterase family protein [Alcanivorax sp. JB21]|uniref:carboxylesterase/lipase family protein n=1 Tax=Alcanivorax limicola TaxID=2874102 RepID=UPI001CBE7914|nr:carboxylesterase family protein [Alcanivorax limicola]MBZ2187771.1 carboxylesterase family protein [Alcanivorax limicola]
MTVVETESGKVSGLPGKGCMAYRGIPFAAPASGALRFRAPQPVPPWQGVRAADRFAVATWQEKNPLMGVEEIGDDCLAVNIWVPEGEGPFPVMVWFHGGGYLAGSPSQLLYNGEQLARTQNVIVVNAAYRLGAWGYGWFADLAPSLEADGNLGLRDQVAALAWVQRNIGAFGGDPAAVTIFGESAGAFSVATLLATPSASALFHRAILQSGAGDMVLSPDEASRVAEMLVAALPGDGNAADKLRQASPKDVVRAQRSAVKTAVQRGLRSSTPQFGMTFLPVVDGDLLPEVPVNAIAAGCARDKILLAGTCRDEWHLFQYAAPFNGGASMQQLRALGDDDIQRRFQRALPAHGEAALAAYQREVTPHAERSKLDWLSAMETDRVFRVPTRRLLDAQVAAGGSAWGFEFTWEVSAFGVPLGACHVSDVPFVFGITDTPVGQLFTGGGEAAAALSQAVQTIWGGFAAGKAPGWADWASSGQVRLLGRESGMADYPGWQNTALPALWDEIIDSPISEPIAG